MESGKRPIEIFAPFGAAWDLTKLILFQPFDLAKWCVIGFAAFLANLGSAGFGFNYNTNVGKGDWTFRTVTHDSIGFVNAMPTWLIVVVGILAVILIFLVVVVTWVSARGKFIFTDCVVRNRGAIVEPWKEFKREGNSLFLFLLAAGVIFLLLLGLAGLPLWWPLARHGEAPQGTQLVVGLALLASVFAIFVLAWSMIASFMIPIMYRRRCGATQGFRETLGLIMNQPRPVILFFLFSLVLWVAIAIVTCVTTCLTCCIAAIPYVGTVILLPLHVFWMSYLLLFMRQFGQEWDVWANLAPAISDAPPIQTTLPPIEPPPLPQQ